MKVINFEEKKRQKEDYKRYEYIKSMCQFQRPDLFDKLIAQQEITSEKIHSCNDFLKALEKRGINPSTLFEESIFIHEHEFHEDWNINWWIAIDEALTYYTLMRTDNRDLYNKVLAAHPFL